MTGVSQFESHPDAEQLAAFAERALVGHEQSAVLAHLAACSHCRQIVFLASEAASQEAAEAIACDQQAKPAAPVKLARQAAWWPSGWRMAYMPTGALAMILLTLVLVRQHHNNLANQAQLQQPPTPAPKASLQLSPVPEVAKAATLERKPAPAAATPSAQPEAMPLQQPAPPALPTVMANKSVAISTEFAMPTEEASVPATAIAPAAPAPAQSTADATSLHALEYTARHNAADAVQMERSPSPESYHVTKAATSHARMYAHNGPTSSGATHSAQVISPTSESALKLPGGMTPASIVRGADRMLALDLPGTLYLSTDHGATWKQVNTQWSGHAVAVMLHNNAASTRGILPQKEANLASDLFELSNDQGQLWKSTDGLTWSAE
jgi:hypothetical protein